MDPFELPVRPEMKSHRDIPVLGDTEFDEVLAAKRAIQDLALGQFARAAMLCDAFVTDDRLDAVLETRLDALASLPVEFVKNGDARRSAAVAKELEDAWKRIVPMDQSNLVRRSGLLMNLGVAEIIWERSASHWTPRLKWWDARFAMWRWDTRSYWMVTQDGPVEMVPGAGKWLLYTPFGFQRGWAYALARSLCKPFLIRQWGTRDWARNSEVHGQPIKKGIVPTNADGELKKRFIAALRTLGKETTLQLEQDAESKFDLELLEAQVQSWEGFQKLIDLASESMAVRVLGQNLTTNVKGGGSYAAINVHDRIRLDRLEWDAQSWSDALFFQLLRPYAHFNFGDAELAPKCLYSTKAPEDRAATAKTLNDLGFALDKLRKAGMNVDLVEVARRFNLPLIAGEPTIAPTEEKDPAASDPTEEGSKEESKPEAEG